jgi:FtsZ-interacting cell division protein ZipA
MKLLESNSGARNTVLIYTADERNIVGSVQAVPTYRLESNRSDRTQFTFWETPTGTARALRSWYYPNSVMGEEFAYPAHPKELTENPPDLDTSAAAPETPAQPQADLSPAPAPETQERQPVEVAANTAAPEPDAEPAPAPEPAPMTAAEPQTTPDQPANAPAQMPKTASPFPLMGLCGALSMCLAGLFRLVRSS